MDGALWEAADDVRRLADPSRIPADAAAMCRIVEEVPGVRLSEVLSTLTAPDALRRNYDRLLRRITDADADTDAASDSPD
nr:hypothetical protein GCM10020093_066300 [Planobispora longispora]